jgi:hypothetical protein
MNAARWFTGGQMRADSAGSLLSAALSALAT